MLELSGGVKELLESGDYRGERAGGSISSIIRRPVWRNSGSCLRGRDAHEAETRWDFRCLPKITSREVGESNYFHS